MKVIGLDPSFTAFGVAIAEYTPRNYVLRVEAKLTIESIDVFETEKRKGKKSLDDLRRAQEIWEGLSWACRNADLFVMEVPAGSQSNAAARALGIALGLAAAAVDDRPLLTVTAREVKEFFAGDVKASKATMVDLAHRNYPHLPWNMAKRNGVMEPTVTKNEHMADAIAVMLTGLDRWTREREALPDAA